MSLFFKFVLTLSDALWFNVIFVGTYPYLKLVAVYFHNLFNVVSMFYNLKYMLLVISCRVDHDANDDQASITKQTWPEANSEAANKQIIYHLR